MTTPKSLLFLFRSVLVVTALFVSATAFNPAWAQELSTRDIEREANAGNFDKAYEVLVQLAESGSAQAQGFLAYVLYEGEWGVPVDEAKAKKWMQAALGQNDAYAHLFVGLSNAPDNTDQTAKDPSLIVSHDWKANIRIAAENGHPYAQNMMGDWALQKRNFDDATEWYRKAAEPDRDYYVVNMLLAKTWYTNRDAFQSAPIYEKGHAGNAYGFRAMALATHFGINTLPDYRQAYIYSMQAHFLGAPISVQIGRTIGKQIPDRDKLKIAAEAFEHLTAWMKDPSSYLGQSSTFCIKNDKYDLNCLKQAVDDHRYCEIEYTLWSFDRFTEFPAYLACREQLSPLTPTD